MTATANHYVRSITRVGTRIPDANCLGTLGPNSNTKHMNSMKSTVKSTALFLTTSGNGLSTQPCGVTFLVAADASVPRPVTALHPGSYRDTHPKRHWHDPGVWCPLQFLHPCNYMQHGYLNEFDEAHGAVHRIVLGNIRE